MILCRWDFFFIDGEKSMRTHMLASIELWSRMPGKENDNRAIKTSRKRVFFFFSFISISQNTCVTLRINSKHNKWIWEHNIWSECPKRVCSAAAPAAAVEWNESRNVQMMQNNLIICYIYNRVSPYWRHPGYWKAFDEQRFCVIFLSYSRAHISFSIQK